MRVLVTGGAGFIGSHIVEHFQGKADIRVLDNLRSGNKQNLESFDHEFIEASILDRSTVAEAVQGVDYVFHLAAMVSVPESVEDPATCEEINTEGTLVVLEEAAKAGVKKLCLASSAAIYGDNPTVPKLETMPPEPESPYASTKLAAEHHCATFAKEGKLNTSALRFFNVFGPRQNPESQYAAAVPIFIDRAVANKDITIYGDGEQTRDFVYVKDIVAANVFLAERPDATGVFNVAYGGRITINDLATGIIKLCDSSSAIHYEDERAGDVKHSTASVDKLMGLGWQPGSSLDEGLDTTIAYFRQKS
jgi:UDP-glucose 4-epimerase